MSSFEAIAREFSLTAPAAVAIGAERIAGEGRTLSVRSPVDGRRLAELPAATAEQTARVVERAARAFQAFRVVPAPRRGELVRRYGEALRAKKESLAELVTWECGKIRQEALGEVQEMIDVCDFAVGLSRKLEGSTLPSERPNHRLMEQWHPLGPIGVITAFNFPVAVWAWNAALALVAGDPVVWKPSEKTPLTALACQSLAAGVIAGFPDVPADVVSVVVGGADVGEELASSRLLPLVSATGSVRMGRRVAETVARRLGRSLLELGGNNALVAAPSADLELATRAIVFGAVGTAGQRCTTLRRLVVHRSIADALVTRLGNVYQRLPVGDPFAAGTLVGPLIDEAAWLAMSRALGAAESQGGRLLTGGTRTFSGVPEGGVYVRPAIVEIDAAAPIVQEETFAPILYVHRYEALTDAIAINNSVPQGLSSAIFTTDQREAEAFVGPAGSDCGLANVNTGTSGAEIGGAFGGEKDTGGGRESGSDSWKAYMRRATTTVNYGAELPLAQGIEFDA
ncbi:MAG TPA: aldehyde dehydrogenase family protein [Polyangiaceae bacterium]|nr:aldehyde dehydrogenase family protein [Polyangiaceae bacterium]